jgi:hypothetical protein
MVKKSVKYEYYEPRKDWKRYLWLIVVAIVIILAVALFDNLFSGKKNNAQVNTTTSITTTTVSKEILETFNRTRLSEADLKQSCKALINFGNPNDERNITFLGEWASPPGLFRTGSDFSFDYRILQKSGGIRIDADKIVFQSLKISIYNSYFMSKPLTVARKPFKVLLSYTNSSDSAIEIGQLTPSGQLSGSIDSIKISLKKPTFYLFFDNSANFINETDYAAVAISAIAFC